jgi:DNA-directed RNA polymerase subunit F
VISLSGRKISEKTVSIPEVKKLMEEVKEKVTEIDEEGMTHFQEITYNYVNQFSKMSDKDAKKIIKFLIEKYEFEETYAINIVNIDPQTIPELRIVLEKSYVGKSLSNEALQEILYQIQELKTS